MEVTRRAGQIAEVPHGHEGFVDQALLHLLIIKLEAKAVVVGICMQRLAQLLDGGVLHGRREDRLFCVLPGDLDRGAEIFLRSLIVRHPAPGERHPVRMHFHGADQLGGIAPFSPMLEENNLLVS